MAVSNTQPFTTGTNAEAAGDIINTNNILLAIAATAWTMDVTTTTTALTAALPETTSSVLHAEFIPALNAFFIGKLQVETNLLSPTTLAVTRRPTLPAGRTARAYLTDNIAPALNLFLALDDFVVYKASWGASSVSLSFSGSFLSGASTFGTPTGMANMGAYQIMMVFVTRATAPTYIVVLDKLEMKPLDTSALTIPGLVFVSGTATGMTTFDQSTFFWGQIYSAASVFNFHTYQVRVDPCILRNYLGVCTTCIKPTILIGNTSSNICNFSTSVPDGWGINSVTAQATKCKDANCLLCGQDYLVCTSCDTSKGVKLVGGTCQSPVLMGASFVPTSLYSTAPYTSCGQVVLWLKNETSITLPPALSNSFLNTEDEAFRPPNLTLKLQNSLGSVQNFTDYRVRALAQSQYLMLELSCSSLPLDTYKLMMEPAEFSKSYTIDTVPYNVVFEKAEFQLGLVGGLPETDPSGLVWAGTYGLSSIDQPTSTSMGFVALTLDPTGTFFRFTKILQIVNKLYFININYGKRLEAFLAKCKIALQNYYNDNELVYHSANFRGRLDQGKSGVSLLSVSRTMIVFYLLSWALQVIKRFMLDHCTLGRVGIYFCHYANKVHLIVFNLVFVDFLWLAPRTLLHSRDLSRLETNGAILVLCLVGLDLYMILAHLLDRRVWLKALEHLIPQNEYKPLSSEHQDKPRQQHQSNTNPGQVENNSMLLNQTRGADETMNGLAVPPDEDQTNLAEIDFEKEGYWKVAMKQINYKKTYFEIDFNVHLMEMATWHLRMAPATESEGRRPSEVNRDLLVSHWSQQSMLCKVLVVYPWFRASLLQITIQNTQYAVFTGIWVLFALELARLFATIYAYLKYKYLKNIICLLMEVLPSGLLSLFFVIALLISPKRFDEPVIDFYQDAGIWIVIASCVAEYLLLITYITVAAYEFIKNRNMMKKMKVKRRVYSLFQFDDLRPWLLGKTRPFEHQHPLDPDSPEQAAPMSVVADANISRQGEVGSIDMRIKPIQRRMQQVQVNAVMPVSNTSAQKIRANLNNELSRLSEMNRGGLMPRSMMGKSKGQADTVVANPVPASNQSPPSRRNGGSPSPESARRKRSPPPNLLQQERQTRGNQLQQQQTEVSQNPDLSRLQTNQNDTTQDPLRAQATITSLNQNMPVQALQNRDCARTFATQQSGVSGAANLVDDSLMTRTGDSRMQMNHMQINAASSQQQQQIGANPQPVVNGGNYLPMRDSSPKPMVAATQHAPKIDQQMQYTTAERDRSPEVVGGSSPNLQNSRGYLVPIKPSNIPTLTNFTPGQGIMDYATMLRFPNQVMIPGFGLDSRALDPKSGQYELGSGVPLGKDESSSHGGVKELPREHPLGLEGKPILPQEFTTALNRLSANGHQIPSSIQPNSIGLNSGGPGQGRPQQSQNPSNSNPAVHPTGVRMPPPRQRSPQPSRIPNPSQAYGSVPVGRQESQPQSQALAGHQSGQPTVLPRGQPNPQGSFNQDQHRGSPGVPNPDQVRMNMQQRHLPSNQTYPAQDVHSSIPGQPHSQGQNYGRPQPQNPQIMATSQAANLFPPGAQAPQRPQYGSPPPQRVSSPKPDMRPRHSSNSPRQRPQQADPQIYRQPAQHQGQYQTPQPQSRLGPIQSVQQNTNYKNQYLTAQEPRPVATQGIYNPQQQLLPMGRLPANQPQGYPQARPPTNEIPPKQEQYPPRTLLPPNSMNPQQQNYPPRGAIEQPRRGLPDQKSSPPPQRVDPRSGSLPPQPRDQGRYETGVQQLEHPRQPPPQILQNQPARQSSPSGQMPLQGRIPPQGQPHMQPQSRPIQQGYPNQPMLPPQQNPRQGPLNQQYQNPGVPQQQFGGPQGQPIAPTQNQSRSLPPGQRPGPPAMSQPQNNTSPVHGFVLPPHPRQRSPPPSAINYTLHPIREAPARPAGSRSPPPQERQAAPPPQGLQVRGLGQPVQVAAQQDRQASPPPQLRQASPPPNNRQASPSPQDRQASPPPQLRQGSPGPHTAPPPQGSVPRNRKGSPQPQPGAHAPQPSRSPPPRQQ